MKPVDLRNITDDLKGKSHEEIKQIIDARRRPFGVLICNLSHDLNIGNIIRSANAFSAARIIIYGRKKYDRRGAVGTNHYEEITFARDMQQLVEAVVGYNLIAIDNTPGSLNITKFEWPRNNAMLVFGHESDGIAQEVLDICPTVVGIPQTGSVRSINVASAAAIAMYDLVIKNNWL